MSDWMTIRVVLQGRPGETLEPAPGRVMLVHADHSLADLADGINTAFGRWDLTPLHEFVYEGSRFLPAGDPDDPEADDTEELTVGELGLRAGSRLRYTFDLGEAWHHECTVEETGVVPAVDDEDPGVCAPTFGWGWVPDQYGRLTEDEDDDDGTLPPPDDPDGIDGETSAWDMVATAIGPASTGPPDDELAVAADRLRAHAGLNVAPYDVLFAAAGLEPDTLSDDDTELWIELAAGVVAPRTATPLDPAVEAAWSTLEPADWAGAIIGLVRGDVGQSADPEVLVSLIEDCPDVVAELLAGDDRKIVVAALNTVVGLWQALGAVDADRRLTALGRWGLPEALRLAWAATPV